MSAVNTIVTPNGSHGYIVHDGIAIRLDNGKIVSTIHPKATWLPVARIAVGFRGPRQMQSRALAIMGAFRGFDAAVKDIQEALTIGFRVMAKRRAEDVSRARLGLEPLVYDGTVHEGAIEVTIMGWSERDQRVSLCCASSVSAVPFAPVFSSRSIAPAITADQLQRCYWPSKRDTNLQGFIAALRRVIEAQRENAVAAVRSGSWASAESVGGMVKVMTVTRDGCEERALFAWPDKVGERLADAEPVQIGEPPPAPEDAFAKAVRMMAARAAA
jgi:hypothetical protein